ARRAPRPTGDRAVQAGVHAQHALAETGMILAVRALVVPRVARAVACPRAVDDRHFPLLRVLDERFLRGDPLRRPGDQHYVARVLLLDGILDGEDVPRLDVLEVLDAREARLLDDLVVVEVGGGPRLAEPACQVVAIIAVAMFEQGVDEAATVGVRGVAPGPAGALPLN